VVKTQSKSVSVLNTTNKQKSKNKSVASFFVLCCLLGNTKKVFFFLLVCFLCVSLVFGLSFLDSFVFRVDFLLVFLLLQERGEDFSFPWLFVLLNEDPRVVVCLCCEC